MITYKLESYAIRRGDVGTVKDDANFFNQLAFVDGDVVAEIRVKDRHQDRVIKLYIAGESEAYCNEWADGAQRPFLEGLTTRRVRVHDEPIKWLRLARCSNHTGTDYLRYDRNAWLRIEVAGCDKANEQLGYCKSIQGVLNSLGSIMLLCEAHEGACARR